MRNLRFNQVFVALLTLSFCSAFLLPPDLAGGFRGFARLFAPVSFPARKLASAVRNRIAPEQTNDQRDVEDVKRENAELRTLVQNLSGQVAEMRKLAAEMEAVGDVRDFCTLFRVVGNDPAPNRESLTIVASGGDGVQMRMAVLYSAGLVGRIERVNAMGSQVQLITDPQFRAAARFTRLENGSSRVLETTQPLLVGTGRGAMEIINIPLKETENGGIRVGDSVVLDDADWPMALRHRPLGHVESISQHDKAATFATIRVRPAYNLETLSIVMVMNRTAPDAAMKSANIKD